MYEEMEECCDKAENVDKEVLDIDSDKFDIDVWKVFTREKLMRQKERAEKEKACADAIKEIKEDLSVIYTANDDTEAEVEISFVILKDCSCSGYEENFYIKVTDFQKY